MREPAFKPSLQMTVRAIEAARRVSFAREMAARETDPGRADYWLGVARRDQTTGLISTGAGSCK